MGCWAGVAGFPFHCKRCSWIGEKKQETRNKRQETRDKKQETRNRKEKERKKKVSQISEFGVYTS